MMYKSQFQKIYPYDWFCGPGITFDNQVSQYFCLHVEQDTDIYFKYHLKPSKLPFCETFCL